MRASVIGAVSALLLGPAAPAIAQDDPDRACTILCAPELKIEPTFTIEHNGLLLSQFIRASAVGEGTQIWCASDRLDISTNQVDSVRFE